MCFGLAWLEHLLVWCVVIGAAIAILKLVIPLALGFLGGPGGVIAQIINIVIWAVVVIAIIYIAFGILSCLVGSGGLSFPHR